MQSGVVAERIGHMISDFWPLIVSQVNHYGAGSNTVLCFANPGSSPTTHKPFDPSPLTHPSQKRGAEMRDGGGGGSKLRDHGGIIGTPNMMILQGVRHLIPYLGVCYGNDPKKRGVNGSHTRLM